MTAFQTLLPDAAIDAAEIDPAVVRMARKYFDLRSGDRTRGSTPEDGRVFVKRMQRRGVSYDLIVLDAFDHEYIPEHMLTREFLLEVKSLLGERGVLAANTFSVSKLYDHESATYYSVFGDFYGLKQNNRVILLRLGGLPDKAEIARNAELAGTETAAARRRPRVAAAADRDRAGLARRHADPDRPILAVQPAQLRALATHTEDTMDFTGKVALITGAAGSLGKAVADAFDAAGARQALVDIDDGVLNKVYGAGNDRRYTVAANLLDEASTKRAADAALAKFGRIDVLCNIAGGSARVPRCTKRRPRPGSGCSTSTRRRSSTPPGRSCRR